MTLTDTPTKARGELENFLDQRNSWPKILFAKVWGSRSHNTELPDSDWDFSGVYLAKTKEILGFRQPSDTREGKDPDFQFHEAGKFCLLLMKGNPGIVEMLFTDKKCVETSEWLWLKSMRRKFLSKQVVSQYLGYATGQLKKLQANYGESGLHTKGGKYNEKFAYHMVRLLQDALRISRGGEPLVWKDGHDRDFLMRVRNGEYTWQEVSVIAKNLIAEIDNQKPWQLPEQGDEAALEEWLVTLRMRNL